LKTDQGTQQKQKVSTGCIDRGTTVPYRNDLLELTAKVLIEFSLLGQDQVARDRILMSVYAVCATLQLD